MKKDKWIEEILQVSKEIQPVASNPYMAVRVETKLSSGKPADWLPVRWVYVSAIAVVCLIAINLRTWSNSRSTSTNPAVQQLAREYGWESNDLYSVNITTDHHE